MPVKILQSVTRSGLWLGVALSLALMSVSAQASAPLEQRRFETNLLPSIDSDFADPFVLRDESGYFALSTGANGQHTSVGRVPTTAPPAVHHLAMPMFFVSMPMVGTDLPDPGMRDAFPKQCDYYRAENPPGSAAVQ